MSSRAMAASIRAESEKLGTARFDDHVRLSVVRTSRAWLDRVLAKHPDDKTSIATHATLQSSAANSMRTGFAWHRRF